eukprot:7899727-Pyramimonas_sp.AAC.1
MLIGTCDWIGFCPSKVLGGGCISGRAAYCTDMFKCIAKTTCHSLVTRSLPIAKQVHVRPLCQVQGRSFPCKANSSASSLTQDSFGNTTDIGYANARQEAKNTEENVESLLAERRWCLTKPDTEVHQIVLGRSEHGYYNAGPTPAIQRDPSCHQPSNSDEESRGSFLIVRDDLLHPLTGGTHSRLRGRRLVYSFCTASVQRSDRHGNKLRKLDALLPLLQSDGATDVLTCGGCQSAHTAAVGESSGSCYKIWERVRSLLYLIVLTFA